MFLKFLPKHRLPHQYYLGDTRKTPIPRLPPPQGIPAKCADIEATYHLTFCLLPEVAQCNKQQQHLEALAVSEGDKRWYADCELKVMSGNKPLKGLKAMTDDKPPRA